MTEIITHFIIICYQHFTCKIYVRKNITILIVASHFSCLIMHEVVQIVYLGKGGSLPVPGMWFINCCVGRLWASRFPKVSALFSLVPEPVKDLTLRNRSTEDLRVTWSRAEGDVDQYEIQLLFSDMRVFPPFHLVNTATEFLFTSLTPGRRYKILVLTISGDLQQSAFIEGLTGNLKYCFWTCVDNKGPFKDGTKKTSWLGIKVFWNLCMVCS